MGPAKRLEVRRFESDLVQGRRGVGVTGRRCIQEHYHLQTEVIMAIIIGDHYRLWKSEVLEVKVSRGAVFIWRESLHRKRRSCFQRPAYQALVFLRDTSKPSS